MQSLPLTSLIISSRNRQRMLTETIESILGGEEMPSEILVIDQSDTPDASLLSRAGTEGSRLRYIHQRSVGLSRAQNRGIAGARHDILVFTHDDVLVTPNWFGNLVRALLAAGPRTVVTGQVRPTDAERKGGFAPSIKTDELPAIYAGRIRDDVLFPLNMAFHRNAILEVGEFDERLGPGTRFPAAEDNDFGFRLLEAGYRIHYVPEAVLYHRAWRAHSDYLALRWAYGRGQGAYYAKHLSLRDRHMLGRMLRDLKTRAWQCIRAARRDRRQALGAGIFAAGLLSGAGQWLITSRLRRTFR